MVLDDVPRAREPEQGELRQHRPAVRDAGRQDEVERGDAIGRHHQQPVGIQLVGVTDLSAREQRQIYVCLGESDAVVHVLTPKPSRSKARSTWRRNACGSKIASIRPPIRAMTAGSASRLARKPPSAASARCAADCTMRYASSRLNPLSTSASSAGCENTMPPLASRFRAMRSGRTSRPARTRLDSRAMKSTRLQASGNTTRSAELLLMSLSCQRAMSSSAVVAYPRTTRARPHTRSASTGLRLWGMADDPFCSEPKGSEASPTSVRWRWRISSAMRSSDPAATARAFMYMECRSRDTI